MKLPVQSIRWRIQAWHGLLLALVLAGFGATAWRLMSATEYRQLDSQLRVRLSALHQSLTLNPDGMPGPPPEARPPPRPGDYRLPPAMRGLFDNGGYYYVLWTRNGALFGKSANAPAHLPRPERTGHGAEARSLNGNREYFDFTPPGECLLAGIPEASLHRSLRKSAELLAALGLVVLVLGLTGGWWLASRAIRPIDEISATVMRIAAGKMDERINIAHTDSELGKLATVLNETFGKLASTFDQQARFTSDAAHELRTPVSVILAQAQLALARPRQPEEYRETIQTTQRAARRMHALIDSLLDLSMLADQRTHLLARPCDLAEIGREQLDLIRPLADQHDVTLAADLGSAQCVADEDRITQVFANLLANAVKFNHAGGEVRLSTLRENGSAIIRVSDTGAGIAAEHLPHLFERFYRAEESRSRTTGGAGLGLAICKSIAEAHGGAITVESELGRGSTFTLRIPAADSKNPP
ncbi:MAG TPA: ATP-binding protein [Chthoniobacteraceae bacterium]|jgi:signal transduction histidine kinase|nr:ATP-binding protein [Chthoniobacteraceae bacterium]